MPFRVLMASPIVRHAAAQHRENIAGKTFSSITSVINGPLMPGTYCASGSAKIRILAKFCHARAHSVEQKSIPKRFRPMRQTMDARRFIARIKSPVRDSAVDETLRVMQLPPGRRPPPALLEQANWFRSLSHEDQRRVSEVAMIAANRAIFGFLCVLDGVRVIEDNEIKGDFELNYVKDGRKQLNGPDPPCCTSFSTTPTFK